MISTVLIGRCNHETTVRFPYYWCEEIIDFARSAKIKVVDLQSDNFCEEKFNSQVEEHNPELILLNGHGNEICASGHNEEPVLMLNKNDHLLINRTAHVISCRTALLLGQLAKDKGCKGYLGYEGLFYIKNLHPEPSIDVFSKHFKNAVNVASIALLEGKSVEEAFLKSQESYNNSINLFKSMYLDQQFSDNQRDFLNGVIQALEANKLNQVFI